MSPPALCKHDNFSARVAVARLENEDKPGQIRGFVAEIRIHCVQCQREFQFLGLEPGVDTQGARCSVDGLEAQLAICPQGQEPSPLDRMQINWAAPPGRTH